MNKKRRNILRRADELLLEFKTYIDQVIEEEQEALDNIPESFTEKIEASEEVIEMLEEIISAAEELESNVEEVLEL